MTAVNCQFQKSDFRFEISDPKNINNEDKFKVFNNLKWFDSLLTAANCQYRKSDSRFQLSDRKKGCARNYGIIIKYKNGCFKGLTDLLKKNKFWNSEAFRPLEMFFCAFSVIPSFFPKKNFLNPDSGFTRDSESLNPVVTPLCQPTISTSNTYSS